MTDRDKLIHVGTWLLPEGYGDKYDHFTQTRCVASDICIPLYAKAGDLIDSGQERLQWMVNEGGGVHLGPVSNRPGVTMADALAVVLGILTAVVLWRVWRR